MKIYKKIQSLLRAEKWLIPYSNQLGGIPVALLYPNSYSVGMSNLGFQVVFRELLQTPGISVVRFFPEFEISIDGFWSLKHFRFLLVSLSWELDFINFLKFLNRHRIPLLAKDRREEHPIIIAGGPVASVAFNTIVPFFDLVFIGEAEEALGKSLLETLGKGREKAIETLLNFPWFMNTEKKQADYHVSGKLGESIVISKRFYFSSMALIEVTRGCPFKCRFCLGAHLYPFRQRNLDEILEYAKSLPKGTRLGLVGFSVSIYNHLLPLLEKLAIPFSLPSARFDVLPLEAVRLSAKYNKTLTLAPETFSEKLQRIINKSFNQTKLIKIIEEACLSGYKKLKFYFMFGLPEETHQDLTHTLKEIKKIVNSFRKIDFEISFSVFVPKPCTPLGKAPFISLEEYRNKKELIVSELSSTKAKVEIGGWEEAAFEYMFDAGIFWQEDLKNILAKSWRKIIKERLSGKYKEDSVPDKVHKAYQK